MEISTNRSVNINKQANPILGNYATVEDFEEMAEELMNRDWVVEYPRNTFQVINLQRNGYRWNYDNRKTSLGRAQKRKKLIRISKWFLDANLHGKAYLMEDVFRHEIAHCIDYETRGTSDHSQLWKNVAVQVGAEPTRLASESDYGEFKWTLKCNNCGKTYRRHRRTRQRKACGDCCRKHSNGRFDSRFELQWIKNF